MEAVEEAGFGRDRQDQLSRGLSRVYKEKEKAAINVAKEKTDVGTLLGGYLGVIGKTY